MKKRILSCFMALALCLTLLPTAALAADSNHTVDDHSKFTKLWMEEDGTLKKGDNPWTAEPIEVWGPRDEDKETAYALTEGTYYLGSDIEITQHPIMITGNVTLCLNGKQITCGSSAPECVIGVYAYAASELTLTDCGNTGRIAGGKNYGVKVYKGYTLNMHGGTITGGGVGVKLTQYCEFTMSGGTISNNKGGVSTGGGTFTMNGGEISGNTAKSNGGGVYVSGGTFTMNGGEIKSNIAKTNGGGVYVTKVASSNSAFTMNGGAIKSNTANTAGGGVFVENGTFTVSGKPIVSENTSGSEGNKVTDNVYLPVSKTITIDSGLTNGTDIGVTTGSAMAPTEDSTIAIATATENAHGYRSYFKSDNDSYEIVQNQEDTQLVLKAKPRTELTSRNTTITITNTDGFVYSGQTITPTVTVTYNDSKTDDSKTLELGKDYTVTSGDSGTDAKEYTLTIEGKGNYTGSVEKKWTITPLIVSVSSVTLNDKVYDGTTAGSSSDVASVKFTNGSSDSNIVTLKNGDYTIGSVTYDDANVSRDAQNVEVEVTLQNRNYTFGNTQTTQVGTQGKITQAPVNNLKAQTGEINVVNNKEDTYTLDLNKLLPTLPAGCEYGKNGKITYKPTYKPDKDSFKLGNYNNSGTFSISKDGMLTLPIAVANNKKVGDTIGEGKVTAKTQNYEDITLTIIVKVVAAPPKDPEYTPPEAKSGLVYTGKALALITEGTATNGTMQYSLTSGSGYSTDIPMATDAGDYTVYYKVVGDSGYSNTAVKNIPVHIDKAKPTGEPIYTKITAANKHLKDANLQPNSSWPEGKLQWVDKDGKDLNDTTEVKADTTYKWIFTPKDSTNYETLTGTVVLYTKSTPVTPSQPGGSTGGSTGGGSSSGGSSSGGSGSSDSNPVIKTETKNNSDGSTTKTETRKDGTVTATTTGKDGSTSKTETKKDGSSVTENKAADGSTGTVKTGKNGQTEASAKLSAKAVEDAKKSGEPVKAPVEVEASRNSGAAPTVKVELPKNAGKTEVEIPVSNAKPGTVAVLVHADGTEEILKASVPTEGGIRLTVDGSATVKIVDNSKDFIDTRNHWAKDAIDFVSARELVNGMSDSIYAPNNSTTRAQLWTILARQNDADLNGGNTWYEKAQLWSQNKGISDGTRPNATINRAQMVTMMWRTAGQPTAGGTANFTDVPADSYYASAVAWAVENGITDGVGNGRFDPAATCTRAQIATFLARSMK